MNNFGILRLYVGKSGEKGFYNLQELGLAKAMSNLKYKCYIFLLDTSIKEEVVEKYSENINIIKVPCKKIGVHGIFKLNILNKYQIDYLQIQSDNQLYAPNVMKYCKKNNIKFYNYIGTLYTDSNNKLKKIFSRICLNRNIKYYNKSKIFSKTPYVKQQLEKLGVLNCNVVPVGLDIDGIDVKLSSEEILKKYKLPEGKIFIIFVGRLEEYKQPTELITLSNMINNDYHLIIVGKGSLKEKILSNIDSKKYSYFEKLPNCEVHELYSISQYFVNFNRNEIYGMSILEALFNGVTVIAYHAPGPDFILHKKTGFLVENINEIKDIIYDKKIIEKNILQNVIIKDFSWNTSAKIIEKYLKEIV